MAAKQLSIEELKYPIGKFKFEGDFTEELKSKYIRDLEEAPGLLRNAVAGLNEEQLDTHYREGGWTVRQVVHHLADSHTNAFIRFKLTLTENQPIIKTYNQELWSNLADSVQAPAAISLDLFEAIQKRFVILLKSLTLEDYKKTFVHPEQGIVELSRNIGTYAWHGNHHIAQIVSLRNRMGW